MSRSLSAQVVQQIMDRIADGTFEDGQALPPEAEFASTLGVSRLTMREAVRVLKDRGVLRVVHGRGTYVAPTEDWTDLASIIHVLGTQTSPRELGLQLIEVRRMIEVGACGLAAHNRTSNDLEALQAHLQDFDDAEKRGDIEGVLMADLAFHSAIVRASANPFLQTIMTALEAPLMRSRRETTAIGEVRERARMHHHAIYAALESGSADAAKAAMRAHMTQTKQDLKLL